MIVHAKFYLIVVNWKKSTEIDCSQQESYLNVVNWI